MKITDAFVLPKDVHLMGIDTLGEDAQRHLQAQDGDFVLTRARGRAHSKVIDGEMATLISGFSKPKTIVDAVLEYCSGKSLDPEATLDAAYPILDELIQSNFLAAEGSDESAPVQAELSTEQLWQGLTIVRPMQVFEDCEVYQAKTATGDVVALKRGRPGEGTRRLTRIMAREATILRTLQGRFTPRLLDHGDADGCSYLVMGWCAGSSAARAAAQLRATHGKVGRRRLLDLCAGIADTYARLHEQEVIHGDVHPGNVLVDEDHHITLVDFGVARQPGSRDPTVSSAPRAGLGYFYEPECAAALLDGVAAQVPTSYAGEQHVLAHMLYQLLSGHGYAQFSAVRETSLRQLAESQPEAFSRWGVAPWPDVERVLRRALSRDPAERYDSVHVFAVELRAAEVPEDRPREVKPAAAKRLSLGERLVDDYVRRLHPAGAVFEAGLPEPPYASINYGSGGVAYFFYRLACIRGDAQLLSWAKLWIEKAVQDCRTKGESAFSDRDGKLSPEIIGQVALYHSDTGLHAVKALIGHAMNDYPSQMQGLAEFAKAAQRPCENIDVTLGTSGVLLGAALLEEAAPGHPDVRAFGAQLAERIWARLEAMPCVAEEKRFRYTGIAHGWSGVLYAMLSWCRAADAPLPQALPERLDQLADLAEPLGNGVRWAQQIRSVWERDPTDFSAGWCNGTAGMIHLWTLAHEMLDDTQYLELAERAALDVIATPVPIGQLCCGQPGQAYGILNLYHHTGERRWLKHAQKLAVESVRLCPPLQNSETPALHYALYKGPMGAALLSADLESAAEACMPMFASEGWKPIPAG
jgi:serine/threonine-protein kinase